MSDAARATPIFNDNEEDLVSASAALALHNLLDSTDAAPSSGNALPPLWHWLAFLPRFSQRSIGRDGHPRSSSWDDSQQPTRRLFAGARLAFPGTPLVDGPLVRNSKILSEANKVGRSGKLRFVTVEHTITSGRQLLIREEQDLVYKSPPSVDNTPEPARQQDIGNEWDWSLDVQTDPTLLFRFSALTYNAHRIHYDREYAMDIEGYSGLVVHGPFQAIELAELCRRNASSKRLSSFTFRVLKPAFDGDLLRIRGREIESGADLAVFDSVGQVTVKASATFT